LNRNQKEYFTAEVAEKRYYRLPVQLASELAAVHFLQEVITMIFPEYEQYMKDSKTYNLIPVYQEIRADFETAVSIFLKVKGKILLESVELGENVGRFSIIGLGRRVMIKLQGQHLNITEYHNAGETVSSQDYELRNPLEKVREYFKSFKFPTYSGLPPFAGGAIGYLGYETVQYYEEIPVNPPRNDSDVPDGLMVVPEVVLVYDTVKRSVFVVALTSPGDDPQQEFHKALARIDEICDALSQPLQLEENNNETPEGKVEVEHGMEKSQFLESVEKSKKYIAEGDIIQVVLSQLFAIKTASKPFEIYRTLRVLNPSPYLFFLDFDDFSLIGSSPEVMVRVQDGEILLKPIAGTRKRGKSIDDDDAIARELLADPKECAEHLMLVDLGRNDLGRVAKPASVKVTDYMKIEKFSHVMHIVSSINARLDEQYDVFDVIRATFPAGTLTGAPKIRAMEIITELEKVKRGPYGGMIFNLGFNGNLDSCITIRTIQLQKGMAMIQAGAGIVADSIPEHEYNETVNKAQALIEAIQSTGTGDSSSSENER
jgi:anthranilate synthase component I